MDYKDAIAIFENNTKRSVVQIERCSVGIANYVFIVSTANEKFVLRCSKDENAYKDTVYWLNRLSVCEIPIPIVLSEGKYKDYSYLILSYIRGDDIGNVYCKLNDSEKKQIAKEVVKIQRKVSRLDIHADMEWTWNCWNGWKPMHFRKNPAIKMITIAGTSPIPNQNTINGRNATGAIGRMI